MWPIQKLTLKKEVPAIHKKRWGVSFAIVISVVLFFYKLIEVMALSDVFYDSWCAISIFLIVFFLLLLSLRCYKYGLDLVHHEAWMKESELIEKKWRAWASKSLLMVDHELLLPGKINKTKKVTGEHQPVVKGQEVTFNPSNINSITYQSVLQELLFALRGRFQELIQSFNFEVVFIKNPDLTSWDDFKQSWKLMGLPIEKLSGYVFTVDAYHNQLSRLLESQRCTTLTILISICLVSEGNLKGIRTESGCVFIFSNEEGVDFKYRVCNSRIFRPLFVNEMDVRKGLSDLINYQPASSGVEGFYLSNIDEERSGDLVVQLNDAFTSKKTGGKSYVKDIDLTSGNLDVWAVMSLSALYIETNKKTGLVSYGEKNGITFNIITPYKGCEGAAL
ncbi:hypothetical protein [Chimaeribacter arupi]|uniref:hypothetical protein n=1 Tax=Chimaeribacter arupi TaxID=2060066 RepID=UPI0011AF0458|nr:hypothetical protein [Chimaeribacter arupi]